MRKPDSDRRAFLAAIGATSLATIAGCTGGTDDGESEPADDTDDTDDTDEESTDTDDESDEPDDSAETVENTVGALIEGEQIHLVVENVTRTTELGEFSEADEGNEFVVVSLAMKNVSAEFVSVSNFLQASLRDDEDYSYDQTFAGGDEPTFNDGQFAPGEVERGAVTFEVPEDASGLELQFDFDVSLMGDIDRAHVDLESETDVHELEQELEVDIYEVGDPVSYQDVDVAVNEVRFEDGFGEFTQPDEGNEYAVVDIEITNETGEEQHVSTALQMLVKDESGYSYQEDFSAAGELDRPFDEGSALADGETRRGEVVYEVPTDLSPLYWVFEFDLWNEGNKTFWGLR